MASAARARSCSTSARSRSTGSRRCCWPARAANARGVPVVLDPVGAGATRSAPRRRSGSSARSTSPSSAATRPRSRRSPAVEAEIRGVESIGREATRRGAGARPRRLDLGVVASVTGPVDHVSDGERVDSRSRTATRCSARSPARAACRRAMTGCFLACQPDAPLEAAAEALVAFGVAGEDAAAGARGPGTFHAEPLRRARTALDPDTLDATRAGSSDEAARDRRRPRDGEGGGRGRRDGRPAAAQGRADGEVVARGPSVPRARSDLRRQRRRRGGARARRRRRPPRPQRPRAPSVRSRRGCCSGSRPRRVDEARRGECARSRLRRRRAGLGDAVEAGRRPADRARRARPDLRGRLDARDRDRRHRRVERRACASTRARPASRSSAPPPMPRAARGDRCSR